MNFKKCHQIFFTNWCLARRKTNWAIKETVHRPQEKLPACLLQICSIFPWRIRGSENAVSKATLLHQENFQGEKTLTGKSCCGSKPVAVVALFSGPVILFLWLTLRDGTNTRVHLCKQDWQEDYVLFFITYINQVQIQCTQYAISRLIGLPVSLLVDWMVQNFVSRLKM